MCFSFGILHRPQPLSLTATSSAKKVASFCISASSRSAAFATWSTICLVSRILPPRAVCLISSLRSADVAVAAGSTSFCDPSVPMPAISRSAGDSVFMACTGSSLVSSSDSMSSVTMAVWCAASTSRTICSRAASTLGCSVLGASVVAAAAVLASIVVALSATSTSMASSSASASCVCATSFAFPLPFPCLSASHSFILSAPSRSASSRSLFSSAACARSGAARMSRKPSGPFCARTRAMNSDTLRAFRDGGGRPFRPRPPMSLAPGGSGGSRMRSVVDVVGGWGGGGGGGIDDGSRAGPLPLLEAEPAPVVDGRDEEAAPCLGWLVGGGGGGGIMLDADDDMAGKCIYCIDQSAMCRSVREKGDGSRISVLK